jgi:hypothetical protein
MYPHNTTSHYHGFREIKIHYYPAKMILITMMTYHPYPSVDLRAAFSINPDSGVFKMVRDAEFEPAMSCV